MNRRRFLEALAATGVLTIGRASAEVSDMTNDARTAWLYVLPLIEMANARARILQRRGDGRHPPINAFITTPNCDTIYSTAFACAFRTRERAISRCKYSTCIRTPMSFSARGRRAARRAPISWSLPERPRAMRATSRSRRPMPGSWPGFLSTARTICQRRAKFKAGSAFPARPRQYPPVM